MENLSNARILECIGSIPVEDHIPGFDTPLTGMIGTIKSVEDRGDVTVLTFEHGSALELVNEETPNAEWLKAGNRVEVDLCGPEGKASIRLIQPEPK